MPGRLTSEGTPEAVWLAAGWPSGLPAVSLGDLCPRGRAVVLAPHPDDEVLGCGGALAALAAAGRPIVVVAVTDGEASHPEGERDLRPIRAAERTEAFRRLGVDPDVVRLRISDGGVDEDEVVRAVEPLLNQGDVLFAPWACDGHPDHEAVARAASRLPADRIGYFVWAWHWAKPDDLPKESCSRFRLDAGLLARKRHAVQAFTSQLAGPDPILGPGTLAHLLRPDEVYLRGVR